MHRSCFYLLSFGAWNAPYSLLRFYNSIAKYFVDYGSLHTFFREGFPDLLINLLTLTENRTLPTANSFYSTIQKGTSCSSRNCLAPSPCNKANVANIPASIQVPAITETERGACSTGQPVFGLSIWL